MGSNSKVGFLLTLEAFAERFESLKHMLLLKTCCLIFDESRNILILSEFYR
jgi:hypothetical protein